MNPVKFMFNGMEASVDSDGFVRLGGAGFHIENAQPDLRSAIDENRAYSKVDAVINERKHYDDGYYLDCVSEALDALTGDPVSFAEVVDAALEANPETFLAFYRSFRHWVHWAWRHTPQTDTERLWDVLNATLNRMAEATAKAEMARLDAMAEV